jgi:hypothetical protein
MYTQYFLVEGVPTKYLKIPSVSEVNFELD